LSVCRLSFALAGNRSFDCFMFSRKALASRSDAANIAWSALNIWPSLKTAIGRTICDLSPREIDCLKLAFVGMTSKQTAESLNCKVRTVDFHLNNAMRKLRVNNRLGAIQRACWLGVM
jgi:LuxR family quorum-sensing system transcriptional regulator SolR